MFLSLFYIESRSKIAVDPTDQRTKDEGTIHPNQITQVVEDGENVGSDSHRYEVIKILFD